ncbi:RecBCD enzyme subunit RecD [Serratia symbiotica]|nr:RecBCD enzyme subunit RecD [Serratia symbiotica]
MMILFLNKAVKLGILSSLDIKFAKIIANIHEPDILLVAAYLSSEVRSGHICLRLDQLQVKKLFSGRSPKLAKAILSLIGTPNIMQWKKRFTTCNAISDGSKSTPLVLNDQFLYFQRMWQNENKVISFLKNDYQNKITDFKRLPIILNKIFGIITNKINWQKIAIAIVLTKRITIISGGPGTGKTTIISKILIALTELYKNSSLRIQLTTPTGKAADRLNKSINNIFCNLSLTSDQHQLLSIKAITLHHLLKITPYSQKNYYHKNNQLNLDVIIIDESSMIDLSIMAHLISALSLKTKVIFIGDHNQLPSIEAGSIFSDICFFLKFGYSKKRIIELNNLTGYKLFEKKTSIKLKLRDSLCLLKKNYRFSNKSGINKLAHAVNTGNFIKIKKIINGNFHDIKKYPLSNIQEYEKLLLMCTKKYFYYLKQINIKSNIVTLLTIFNYFQVICALRTGPFGVTGLNQQIEFRLEKTGIIHNKKELWYPGRPIIIKRNDKNLKLNNGDIGIALLDKNYELKINFLLANGDIKLVSPNQLPVYDIAYAMTVHKSQGSEFNHTVLVLPNYFIPMLTRELIYTAITRARYKFSLYATDEIFKKSIYTSLIRRSGLIYRLINY